MAGETTEERVRRLITESGLTQAEFAAKAGLDAPKMSKSLAGVRRFTSLDLARIADLGGVSVDWLLGNDPVMPSMAARTSLTPSQSASVAIAEARRLAQVRADLAFLGYRQEVLEIGKAPLAGHWIDQGSQLAKRAVTYMRDKKVEPWKSRDLAEAIEEAFGIDVAIIQLPNGFDGLSYTDANTSLMVVGASELPARQRFTIAHELGHLLAGDNQGIHLDANLYDADHKQQPSEKRANVFAAEFLLPEEMLRKEADRTEWSHASLARLACRLWVSPSTLAWRLFNLHMINPALRDSFRQMNIAEVAHLAGAMDSLGEWIEVASRRRIPIPLVRATFQAYADGNATLRPFANLIGVDTDTLRQAISEPREESPLAS